MKHHEAPNPTNCRKPLRTGDAVSLYAAALVLAVCALVTLPICWPAAIPLFLGAALLALWAYFRSPTLVVTEESVTVTNPRRNLHATFPWSSYRCLYRLVGVNRTLLLLSPEPLKKDELRARVAAWKAHTGPVPEVDGCLFLHAGREPASILPYIPESVRRMPYSDCISL